MYAAKADGALPKGYGRALLQTSRSLALSPIRAPRSRECGAGEGPQFPHRNGGGRRSIVSQTGAGHHVATDAFSLFDKLGVEKDGPHAFYLGAELMKAEIAFRLGKRYAQDEPLDWGCATDNSARTGRGFATPVIRCARGAREINPCP